ncbi:DUF11 domain-containing protein [Neorhodopirellula lusitana]|uniref:DUF11 domain-containing protein n=1 Tax=Neorhodopirellula lusitana TaxID=445327 RepID=UPI00384AC102
MGFRRHRSNEEAQSRGNAGIRRRSSRRTRRRLMLEPLEGRRLLAVASDLANLTGLVYDDFSGDGFTAGEEVAGAVLDLYQGDGDDLFEPDAGDTELRMTTTDASGSYSFERLPAGQYFVVQPAQTIDGRTLQRSVSGPITITSTQASGQVIRTIDGYDQDSQSVSDDTNDGNASTSTQASDQVLGGARDLLVNLTSTDGTIEITVNDTNSTDLLKISSDGLGDGRRSVIYDGDGDALGTIETTGLNEFDLTQGGQASGIGLAINSVIPDGIALVRIYSDPGGSGTAGVSTGTLDIQRSTTRPTDTEFIDFDDFVSTSGGGADFTQIGAIEIEIQGGPDYDALANAFVTLGPNVIPVADFSNFESVDLRLSKELVTTNATFNQPVTFTLTLVNEGDDTATGIVVTDTLPAGISYQSNQASIGDFDSTSGEWSIASLPTGATATLSITGSLTSAATQTNTAEVTAVEQFDTDSTPNNKDPDEDDQASASVTATQINLAIDKTVSNVLPNVGDSVTFQIVLSNTGADTATNVVVEDTLPSGLVLTSNSPSTGSFNTSNGRWTVPSLASGEEATLDLVVQVNQSGSFTNVAEVIAADQRDTNSTPDNNDLTEDDQDDATLQTQVADLSVVKAISNGGTTVGDNVTFTITLNNAGPNPATNVDVRDVLPSGLSYVSDSTTLGDYEPSTGVWTLPTVPVDVGTGSPTVLTLVATVQNAGDKTNIVEITSSDQVDSDSTPGNGNTTEDDYDSVVVSPVTIDLALSSTVSPTRPAPGETFTYTLTLTNTSSSDASGVLVQDNLPSGVIFQSSTSGQVYSSSTGIWDVGSIAAGATRTLEIEAVLDPNRSVILDSIVNTAQVNDANEFDTDSTPNNSIASEDDQTSVTITPARADLSLTKTSDSSVASVGEEVTFTITVRNDGPDASGEFIVSDPIPSGATFVSSDTLVGNYDDSTGRWTVPNLADNGSATLSIVLMSTVAGSIDNVAEIVTATLPDTDSTSGNSVASEDDQASASVQAQAINLSLDKAVDNVAPRVGETFRYTISVTNSGPDTATNIVIGETIPSSISIIDSLPESGTYVTSTRRWTIPSLASGASTELYLDARISSLTNLPDGDLVNTAEVLSVDQFDLNSTPGNNDPTEDDQDSVSVRVPIADVSVEKTTLTPSPNVGETARFEIVVSNAGPDIATNLVIRDLLPDGLTYRSDSQSDASGGYVASTGLWSIPSLGVGQSTTLQINADVDESGTFTNVAELIEVDQDDPDSTPDNNQLSEDDQASDQLTTPVIDLSLEKVASVSRPPVGSEVSFTLTVSNSGPDTATGVVVEDTLPSGFQFLSATPSAAFASSTGRWTVGTLASGDTNELVIRGIVGNVETLTNMAEVIQADQFDRDSTPGNGFGNNEDDEASVSITPASADLSLTKSVSDDTPNVGDDVTFTLTIRNDGPDVAESIEVTDSLPFGLTNIRSQTTTGDFDASSGVWQIPTLAVGGSASLDIIATVDFDDNNTNDPVVRTNFAEITASSQRDPDSTPGNRAGEDDEASVDFTPQLIDLALTKGVSDSRPNVNDTIQYEVVVRNDGPSTATGIVVDDPLPSGLTFVSSSADEGGYDRQTGRWTIPELAADQTATLILRATVSPNVDNLDAILSAGIVNVAEIVAADQPDRDSTPDNGAGEDDYAAVTLTLPRADLSLSSSVSNTTPDQDETIQFLVTIRNDGPDVATGIVISESVPSGLLDVVFTPLRGTYSESTNRWTLDQLEVGQSATLQVSGRVGSSDILTNTAEIILADQFDPDSVAGNGIVGEDDLTDVTAVPRVVDVSVSAVVSPEEIVVGDTVQLVVAVQNGSASTLVQAAALADRAISDATGVVVAITVPDGLTLSDVDPASASFDPATGLWVVGDLAAGASQQLTLSFLVEEQSVKSFGIEVVETNEFDIDSTAGNGVTGEDDQTEATIRPPRTLSKRLFLSR